MYTCQEGIVLQYRVFIKCLTTYVHLMYTSNQATYVRTRGGDFVEDELLNAATIAEEAGIPRSTVAKWISTKKLIAVQESKRGNRVSRLFRRTDAQPLIDAAKARRAGSSEVLGGAASS